MKQIFYIASIAASVLLTACGGETKQTENTEQATAEVKLAEFDFAIDEYNFGTIIQGEKVSYSFKFKNTGENDLIITNAKGSCGCTVPNYSEEPVAPGAEGVIDVVFDSTGKGGKQRKTVTLTANTVPTKMNLIIKGEVITPETEAK